MKKIKFAKKSRKLFSAILAGAMLTTSVIPESFVWASEEVQEFGDSESLGFGSTSDPMPGAGGDGENQALSDFQDMPDVQNGNDTVDMESGFTDESDSFGSNGRDSSVGSDFQSLASVEELQERINALPTVEEFQNLADGTTVEGSTLNQAQTDVYTEAQDIAEKLDLLSEEEQGLVDVSRLEALFEYFNGMTEVLADTPTPIGPVTSGSVTIDHGGTYTLAGGEYTTSESSIIIDTTEAVTLNIAGDIIVTAQSNPFIWVKQACSNFTINNDDKKIEVGNSYILENEGATVTFEGGIYTGPVHDQYISMIYNSGIINFKNVTIYKTKPRMWYSGQIVDNVGTINIYDGTVLKNENNRTRSCIMGGTVNMYGGTIKTSNDEDGEGGIYAETIKIVGGIIENFKMGIKVGGSKPTLSIGGNIDFKNKKWDISLANGAMFNIEKDFKGHASVYIEDSNPSFPRRITISGTVQSMLGRITSAQGYSVNYAEDKNGGYLFLSNHMHTWSYSLNDNKIIAKCTDNNCENELELSLTAEDSVYSGEAYAGAEVENNISYVTGKKADIVYYLEDGNTTTNAENSGAASKGAAPVYAGNYVIKVSVEDQTLSSAFKIEQASVTPSVSLEGWKYGQNVKTPQVTVKSGESDITQLYNESQITYTYYTDASCTNKTTKENGAGTNGAVPKNAGTYYVKAVVPVNGNYAASFAVVSFTIKKKSIKATVNAANKTYDGNNFATVNATVDPDELVSGDSITITNLTGTFENQNAGSNKKVTVDSSGISISGTGAENYDVQIAPETTASINKRVAKLTWSKTDLTYTGTAQSVTATVTNAVSVDTFNITYEGNTQTEAGDSYTARVTDLGNENYTLDGATGVSQNWSISYLQTSVAAQVSGTKGNNDWYISPVKLVPDSGYQISTDKTDWKDSIGDYTDQGKQSAGYYLKATATGAVTDKKTATFKIDTEAPTGEIKIGTNSFSSFLNSVTYGHWFKDNADVDITGDDSTSGIASIEYQKVKADESYDVNGTWVTWDAANKLSLTESGKYVIYARITDNAGNQTIINSDGVVVFKDSVVADPSIDYTRTTKISVDAKVTLNGNTVASVKNGQDTLKEGTDYTVSADKITFIGGYLDTLAVGTYTLTVAYHPQGETQYRGGDKPAESQIALKVKQKTVNPTVTIDGWTYGENANTPKVTVKSGGSDITISYNESQFTCTYYTDEKCTSVTNAANGAATYGAVPKNAGTYYVKAAVAENGNYAAGITEPVRFTIAKKSIDATVRADNKTYDGKDFATVNATVDLGELVSDDSITITNLTGTFENQNAGSNKKVTVDSSGISISGTGAENYDVQIAPETTASINKRVAKLTWSKTDLTYTGTAQSVTATVTNAVSVDTFNITYEGNTQTEAGDSYTARVTDLGNENYTLDGATGVSQNWSISYLQTSVAAQVSGTKGNNDWYISPVKLVPDSGYQISTDKTDWKDSIGDYTDQGKQSAGYYLKATATGAVTDKKTATFKIDTEAPTGEIKIGTNSFSSFLNSVTYGHWFKDNADVDITGDDSTSGIASIEYQKVKADESYDVNGTWVTWDAANKLSLTESGKYVIYARITDNAGNQTIINSDGVVVFKDSVVADPSIDYTRTTKISVDAKVTLNGNTVASVKNGQDTLKEGTDYTVSADKITFIGGYLDTLAVGTYTLTVAYHPQGETQYRDGDKPAESQIALKVKQKTVNVTYQTANVKITSVLDKEYDGQPADLVYTTNSTASVKVEYNVNGIWQTKAPTYAGTYEVRVSVPGNSYFTAASTTKTYTIKPRGVEISGITANKKVYDGTKNAELDYSKVVFAGLIEGDALTVSAEGTFADSNAAKGKTVTITNLVLGGRSASNYVLTADGQQTGTIADINPKRITVTADNLKKIVGGADPVLTYTASGLVREDTLSGIVVKRKSGEKVGTYAIRVSQKKGSNPNYRITFKKGIFTIQQADQSKLKGKDIYRLKLPVFFAKGKANKNSITLSWKKYAGATGYDVYWSYCDGRINYKKVGTVKSGKLSMSHKKLKKDHEYKYFIAAYKMVEGRKIYIARSNDVHVALKQASTTNAASIKVNRTEIALSVGKTFQLKCSLKAEDSRKDLVSHTSPFRYYTTNSKVATVNKDGVIKAKGKGVCTIYILANNGVYKKVTVTVK